MGERHFDLPADPGIQARFGSLIGVTELLGIQAPAGSASGREHLVERHAVTPGVVVAETSADIEHVKASSVGRCRD